MRTIKLLIPGKNAANKYVRSIRVRYDSDYGEYRVEFLRASDGKVDHKMTYYCDDKDDALDTAQYEFMSALHGRNPDLVALEEFANDKNLSA